MKRIKTKSLMIMTILFASIASMPIIVSADEKSYDQVIDFDQVNPGLFQSFQGGFGALFGANLGYAGGILQSIFGMLFLQGLNLSAHEMLDNVFVLSANRTVHNRGTYDFAAEHNEKEVYWAPMEYNDLIPLITGTVPGDLGHAYCVVEKSGTINYDLEVGAGVTLVIWDNDKSFINAANKLINFFKKVYVQQATGGKITADLIKEGISILTWFLIHINDIFTGDELFILNPITWQKMVIIPDSEFKINKTWYLTGDTPGDTNINPADPPITSLGINGSRILGNWTLMAQHRNDNFMEWLLNPILETIPPTTVWTQFTFDLIQLWVKNFEIHIDVNQILEALTGDGSGSQEAAIINAFEGCNIELYLFTHHLAGAFLYNDTNNDRMISANYEPISLNGTIVNVPSDNELTHRLVLGDVGDFNFIKPKINSRDKSISWGINIENVDITPVPLGIDLNSYVDIPPEHLEYIYFGFTFEPKTDSELGAALGFLKLDQFFAPWNDPEIYGAISPIDNLDLAIIYVTAVLHFELDIATHGQIPDEPTELLSHESYDSTEHKLMVGDYIGARNRNELEFIDMAGPDYEYGSESVNSTDSASTSLIPLFVWLMERERHDTYIIAGGDEVSTYSTDIRVQIEFNVTIWAVCYPEFENGCGIWHDPTFSVYMIFESEGFWALIVLIAGVGLVGVATVLIKRRKDSRF
ncbi:MAG: hypothetical protein ACFFBI_06920 [Promethearchaeota archaeon]